MAGLIAAPRSGGGPVSTRDIIMDRRDAYVAGASAAGRPLASALNLAAKKYPFTERVTRPRVITYTLTTGDKYESKVVDGMLFFRRGGSEEWVPAVIPVYAYPLLVELLKNPTETVEVEIV